MARRIDDMGAIMGLMGQGRLMEATRSIQARLAGDRAAATPPDGRTPPRDVTPRPARIEGPGTPAKAKGKATRPKPRRRPAAARGGDTTFLPEGGTWSEGGGALPHRLFTPARPDADAPLIVMLHGCTQDPEDFARGTGMCRAADARGARVLWPEQTRARNPNGCWSWFDPAHQGAGGEAGAIAGLARSLAAAHGTRTIHAAGLSAGGAMAAILGTAHADVFASVTVHSGLPAGAARDVPGAFAAMRQGVAAPAPLAVPALVIHGTADRTVVPANGRAFLGAVGPKATVRQATAGGRDATIHSKDGPPPVEVWEIEGLAHAWSGGDPSGSYADPTGPDATAAVLRMAARHPRV